MTTSKNDRRKADPTQLPCISIIIPTYNCSQFLPQTIDSILIQDYPNFEIIAVDAGSTDRTLEVLHSYGECIRLSSVALYYLYDMLNQGITVSTGTYITAIFPGDFYVYPRVLSDLGRLAQHQGHPDLIYGGVLLRDGRSDLKLLFRQLNISLLQRGQQPTSLQGCLWKRDLFDSIGRFAIKYQLQGGFDLLCRFKLASNMRFASLHRALIDHDLRWVTSRQVMRHFMETAQILYRHFGIYTVFKWLWVQKDTKRFFRLWCRKLRLAFIGR